MSIFADHDRLENKNLGWLLLRTFIAWPLAAQNARSAGLKGHRFVNFGFDWSVTDLVKGLFVEGRRNIAGLRRDLPDLFDVLDRGGPIVEDIDTVRDLQSGSSTRRTSSTTRND